MPLYRPLSSIYLLIVMCYLQVSLYIYILLSFCVLDMKVYHKVDTMTFYSNVEEKQYLGTKTKILTTPVAFLSDRRLVIA